MKKEHGYTWLAFFMIIIMIIGSLGLVFYYNTIGRGKPLFVSQENSGRFKEADEVKKVIDKFLDEKKSNFEWNISKSTKIDRVYPYYIENKLDSVSVLLTDNDEVVGNVVLAKNKDGNLKVRDAKPNVRSLLNFRYIKENSIWERYIDSFINEKRKSDEENHKNWTEKTMIGSELLTFPLDEESGINSIVIRLITNGKHTGYIVADVNGEDLVISDYSFDEEHYLYTKVEEASGEKDKELYTRIWNNNYADCKIIKLDNENYFYSPMSSDENLYEFESDRVKHSKDEKELIELNKKNLENTIENSKVYIQLK